ncbi:MAG: hypothetical protein F6K09_18585 [Merismopedia sp. SIO2A8]|nr:hypothetical protein [Merismopedia sp. SIO2A8]
MINFLQTDRREQAKANASINYHSTMEELYAKRDAAYTKLEEIQQAGEEAWSDLQVGFEQAWNELNSAFESAVAKFQ